jgi:hypothetical protein
VKPKFLAGVLKAGELASTRVQVLDFSRSGLRLATSGPLEDSNTPVHVLMLLPPEGSDVVEARIRLVRQADGRSFGVRIFDMDDQSRAIYDAWLTRAEPA